MFSLLTGLKNSAFASEASEIAAQNIYTKIQQGKKYKRIFYYSIKFTMTKILSTFAGGCIFGWRPSEDLIIFNYIYATQRLRKPKN